MVTLSNEPPTLDRDATKHKYTRNFKEMIDLCLQKDPTKRYLLLILYENHQPIMILFFFFNRKIFFILLLLLLWISFYYRPTAERLLSTAFFKQAKKKEFLVTKILSQLPPLEERPHKRMIN